MAEQQWDCVRRLRFLVDVVDVKLMETINLDAFTEVGELVELCLLSPPVEPILPVLDEALDVGEWRSVVPSRFIELKWCQ